MSPQRKQRILWCSESPDVNTGYGVYTKHVLFELAKTGEFELAQLSSCTRDDFTYQNKYPWKIYPVEPAKNDQRLLDIYNSSRTNPFGAWRFEQTCLNFLPDVVVDVRDWWATEYQLRSPYSKYFHWCFAENTPILLHSGSYRNIEDLKINDVVIDGDGNTSKIKNIFSRYASSFVEIKTSSWRMPTTSTDNHKYFVIKNKGRILNKPIKRYYKNSSVYNSSMIEEVSASDINIGDMLAIPPIKISYEKGPKTKTKELASLIGFFLSEGTCNAKNYSVSFAFHREENEYSSFVKKMLEQMYPDNKVTEKVFTTKKVRSVSVSNKSDVEFWRSFYNEDKLKIMPSWVFNSPLWFIKEVLKSLWRGDGCVTMTAHNHTTMEFYTKSKFLATSVWRILLRLKIASSISERKISGVVVGYKISVYNKYCKKLYHIVNKTKTTPNGKESYENVLKIGDEDKNRMWFDSKGWLITKVTSKKDFIDKRKVYDLEISGEHSYLVPYKVHNCTMPTVDSIPQHKQWTESYSQCEALLTYSDWGRDALIEQMGEIPWGGRTSPAASEAYFPRDRAGCRAKLGLPPHAVVFGFVGRNQRRKLFPTLIEAFDAISEGVDTYLICHTSYPDAGWDVNALIKECQNPQKILFTYRCSCGAFSLRPFQSVVAKCEKCGEVASALCNVDRGLDDDDLATVYNCMDLYVQACSNEGFGMPVTEAAACGVTIAVTDYSATEDFIEKLGAIPIPVASLQKEVDTGTDKATLTPESISTIMRGVINTPREYLIKKGQETRELYETNYRSYKDVGAMWANTFRSLPLRDWAETWASPAKLFRPLPPPQSLNDSGEASRWLINNVLGEPERLNTLYHARLNRDIALGFKRPTAGGEYNHELPISMMTHENVNFDSLYSNLSARRADINSCEERRVAIWRR